MSRYGVPVSRSRVSPYSAFDHWGGIVVAPGNTDLEALDLLTQALTVSDKLLS